jgi:hypothetical protein
VVVHETYQRELRQVAVGLGLTAVVGMVSRMVSVSVPMTATELELSSAAMRKVCALFRIILLGCPCSGMRLMTAGEPARLTTTILRSRTLEM